MTRSDLRAALAHPNVQAFLRVIREGESRQDDRAYFMRWGGLGQAPKYFDDLSRHPRIPEPTTGGKTSTAAGAYQATWTTWSEEVAKYDFPDFSPGCQDEFAVARIVYRKALDAVREGRFEEACRLCRNEWTSLPGGDEENAATRRARETYLKWGGYLSAAPIPDFNPDSLETERYDQPEAAMPAPLVPIAIAAAQAFLPRLVELIPTLGAAFGSGSEVQKRNVAAAAMLADAVTKTVGEPNLQAAIERIEREPEKLAEVRAAVAEILPTLTEAGGGGIDGARKANAAGSDVPLWKDRAFLIALVLMLAVFMLLADVFYMNPGNYDSNIRTQIVTAVLGFAGIVGAYFLGSSAGSQRKTNLLANKE